MPNQPLTRKEYLRLAVDLPFLPLYGICCGSAFPDVVHVEPLEGSDDPEAGRSCIVQCGICKKMYVSRWD